MSAMHAEDRPYQSTAKDADGNAGRPIREELAQLEKGVAALDKLIDVLVDRLDLVLVAGYPAEVAAKLESVPREPQAPMVDQLRTIREHLTRVEDRVGVTLGRLQV